MKILCTICSKHKSGVAGFLPARLRYTSPRIQTIEKLAIASDLPFFILSGKYGLILEDEMIPDYDYCLKVSTVASLVPTIAKQIRAHHITEINFYTEAKPSWAPYESAIKQGAELAGATLQTLLQ